MLLLWHAYVKDGDKDFRGVTQNLVREFVQEISKGNWNIDPYMEPNDLEVLRMYAQHVTDLDVDSDLEYVNMKHFIDQMSEIVYDDSEDELKVIGGGKEFADLYTDPFAKKSGFAKFLEGRPPNISIEIKK
tara:strand:+ start:410 stop:802 length:393 start_codon:yes stop_codon:yes gene_type:complete